MNIEKTNNLSFYNEQGILTLNAKQFDTGRMFVFHIMHNDAPFDLSGCTAYLRIAKADGTQFQGHECCTIEDSKVIIKTNIGNGSQILTAAGTNVCELHLEDSDGISLTTWTFHIVVEPRVHDGSNMSSIDSYDVLDNMINMEKERIANEEQRKENETNRNTVFEEKIEETNAVITDCRLVIDAANQKISSFDAEINEIVNGITDDAQSYAHNAKESETNAANAASNATNSAATASQKAGDAAASATLSQSYAVGGTGTREGEDTDNAKEYAKQVQEVLQNLQRTTVTGVKGNKESTYRTGDVNITPDNIGALSLEGGRMKTDAIINMPASSGINSAVSLYGDGYTATIHPAEVYLHHGQSSTTINSGYISITNFDTDTNLMTHLGISLDQIGTDTRYFETIVDTKSNTGFVTKVTQVFSETTLSFYGKNATYIDLGTSGNPFRTLYLEGETPIEGGIRINSEEYKTTMYPAEWSIRGPLGEVYITAGTTTFGRVQPDITGERDLGNSLRKWKNIYATNGTIQTSDRNKKNAIHELSEEKAQSLIYGLKPSTYQMNAGTSRRTHWGMISQDIEDLFDEIGMTSLDFAGFIKSPKMTEEVRDEETGRIIKESEVVEGEYDYSLRYDEFIAPIIKVIQTQHEEIETLTKKLNF